MRSYERKAIVLHHGFFGAKRLGHDVYGVPYFRGVPKELEEQGYDVLVTEVPATASILVRAEALAEQIHLWRKNVLGPDRKITILAHSAGGLDARCAISKFGMSKVDTLLTISTPHHGTPLADLLLGIGDTTGLTGLCQSIPLPFFADLPDGGRCLSTQAAREFNASMPNNPEVRYYSVGGDRGSVRKTSPELATSYLYVQAKEGPNDGVVSVKSAQWGTYLETLPLDHLHQMNFPLPHRWLLGAPSYKDVLLIYRRLAFMACSPETPFATDAYRRGGVHRSSHESGSTTKGSQLGARLAPSNAASTA